MTDTGSNERGTYLRKNFAGRAYDLYGVDVEYSKHVFNYNHEVFDIYCGKSSAATAVASVLFTMCAFLAL